MSEQCYDPEDLEHLLELPAGHEDLHHLETCAACRAQLDFFRSFLSREDVPAGADLADANARLGDFLVREIGGEATGEQAAILATGRRWDLRRWSPVLVAASLVCVAFFVNSGNEQRIVSPTGIVRDMSAEVPLLGTTETTADNGFVLSWQGPAEAEVFQVVVLDVAMTEVERFAVGSVGKYELTRQDHEWLNGPGPFLWYVVALQSGDEIARSAVRILESGR